MPAPAGQLIMVPYIPPAEGAANIAQPVVNPDNSSMKFHEFDQRLNSYLWEKQLTHNPTAAKNEETFCSICL